MEALEWPPFFSAPKRGAFVAMLKLSLQKRKMWLRRAINQSQYNNLQRLQAFRLIAHTNEQHQSIKTDECRALSLSFISQWDVVDAGNGLFCFLFRTSYLMVFGAATFVHSLSMPIQGVFSQTHNVKN